jgi:hypothetical protein
LILSKKDVSPMANLKGSSIKAIEKLFKNQPLPYEQFLASLSPEELKTYKHSMPITWVPADLAASISSKAADLLYPGDPRRLVKLGRDRAVVHITGLYKMVFRILDSGTLLNNAASVWPTLHDTGKASIEKGEDARHAAFCVSGYPELLGPFKPMVEGFILGVLESAGKKNIQVVLDGRNPDLWKWMVSWD